MRRSVHFFALAFFVALFLLSSGAAHGQTAPQLPRMFGTFTPTVGNWGEYVIKDKASGEEIRMRQSIVGKEGDAFWYEVRNEQQGTVNIIKMLVTDNPSKSSENIKRMIIKSGDSPALEMNRDLVVMGRQMATHMFEKRRGIDTGEAENYGVEEMGKREVTVPAGTFTTTQFRIKDGQGKEIGTHDLAESVGVFGLVQSDNESDSMTLVAQGTDAVSAITEDPVPMTAPPGMPQGMPRGIPPGMGVGPKQP